MTAEESPQERFEGLYAGSPPPWDIGRPQRTFVKAAGQVTGRILDAGCGTGENALFFAERGHDVTGIDFLERPILAARDKALSRGLDVRFLVFDALQLRQFGERFDSVIDCGLFHVFPDDRRVLYVDGLAAVLELGGRIFLQCFSDKEPGDHGPLRVRESELRDAYSSGWEIETLEETRFEVRKDSDLEFSKGGPHSWFAVIRKTAS